MARKKRARVPKPVLSAEEKRWQAQNDMESLERAEEIKIDPARVAAAQALAEEKREALTRVARVRPKKKAVKRRR
jgi:hypothetical protein